MFALCPNYKQQSSREELQYKKLLKVKQIRVFELTCSTLLTYIIVDRNFIQGFSRCNFYLCHLQQLFFIFFLQYILGPWTPNGKSFKKFKDLMHDFSIFGYWLWISWIQWMNAVAKWMKSDDSCLSDLIHFSYPLQSCKRVQ